MVVVGQHHHDFVLPGRMQGDSAHCADRALRAAPRADFAVTAIRLQSLTPSRLRRCALRLLPGESPAAYPRRAMLGAPAVPEPAAPDRPRQRRRTLWRVTLLRHSLQLLAHLRQQLIDLLQVAADSVTVLPVGALVKPA